MSTLGNDASTGSDADANAPGAFSFDPTPSAEIERLERQYEPFTQTVRELVEATIRTRLEGEELATIQSELQGIVRRLQENQIPGPAGVRFNRDGRTWNWGNAAVGLRNAVAPPLRVEHLRPGHTRADAVLGSAYEGPPGLVHGGVTALLLDHLMGVTASAGFTRVAFTGTLTLRYERGTPLGPVELEAKIDREEGRKIFIGGTISGADGVSIVAEGVFITPAWADEMVAEWAHVLTNSTPTGEA